MGTVIRAQGVWPFGALGFEHRSRPRTRQSPADDQSKGGDIVCARVLTAAIMRSAFSRIAIKTASFVFYSRRRCAARCNIKKTTRSGRTTDRCENPRRGGGSLVPIVRSPSSVPLPPSFAPKGPVRIPNSLTSASPENGGYATLVLRSWINTTMDSARRSHPPFVRDDRVQYSFRLNSRRFQNVPA